MERRDEAVIAVIRDGFSVSEVAGKLGVSAEREVRRVIYREGNRQINYLVRAVGLGLRRR